MSEYIEVDALMRELEREVDLADDWKTAHEISNVVKYFPTADVRENVRGEWIEYDQGYPYVCSVCRNPQGIKAFMFSFCPNCGAYMRKGVKS